MGSFTVTANSPTLATASGSWNMTIAEISNVGDECTNTYLVIDFTLGGSSFWSTVTTGSASTNTNTVTASGTVTVTPNITYDFRLLQFWTIVTLGGGGGFF